MASSNTRLEKDSIGTKEIPVHTSDWLQDADPVPSASLKAV